MPTPAEIADRKIYRSDELREIVRLFVAMLGLDTPEDAADVSRRLEIEDETAMWKLAERANEALNI